MGKKDKSINVENGDDKIADKSDIKLERPDYDELLTMVNVISKPMASKKMTKKIYKIVKKAAKSKQIRLGVKDVGKALRKKEKGIIVLAGDVSPIDVYSHMAVMCEENKIPYVYVPARIDLGFASQTKRATCVVLVKKGEDYSELYSELKESVKELPLPLWFIKIIQHEHDGMGKGGWEYMFTFTLFM